MISLSYLQGSEGRRCKNGTCKEKIPTTRGWMDRRVEQTNQTSLRRRMERTNPGERKLSRYFNSYIMGYVNE